MGWTEPYNETLRGPLVGGAAERHGQRARVRIGPMESESVSLARIHAAIERLKAEGIDDPTPEEVMDVVAEMQRLAEPPPAAADDPTSAKDR